MINLANFGACFGWVVNGLVRRGLFLKMLKDTKIYEMIGTKNMLKYLEEL